MATERKGWDQILGEGHRVFMNGKEFKLGALNCNDLAAYVEHMKAHACRVIQKAGGPPEVIAAGQARIATGTWGDEDIMRTANTAIGAPFLVARSLERGGMSRADAAVLCDSLPYGLRNDKGLVVLEVCGLCRFKRAGEDTDPQTAEAKPIGDTSAPSSCTTDASGPASSGE